MYVVFYCILRYIWYFLVKIVGVYTKYIVRNRVLLYHSYEDERIREMALKKDWLRDDKEEYTDIIGKKETGYVKVFSDLAPKKRAFVENFIKTKDITKSVMAAGYYSSERDYERKRAKCYKLGYTMLQEPIIREYVTLNMPRNVDATISPKQISERLLLIMNGDVQQKVFDKKGEMHYICPSFRDQVMAANTLLTIVKMQEKNVKTESIVEVASERLEALTNNIKNSFSLESNIEEDERLREIDEYDKENKTDGSKDKGSIP